MLPCLSNTCDLFGLILNFPENRTPLLNIFFFCLSVFVYGNIYLKTNAEGGLSQIYNFETISTNPKQGTFVL